MLSHELLAVVHSLPRADKLRLMQVLLADLAQAEGVQLRETDAGYAVWSPYEAFEAAEALLEALNEDARPTP